MVSSVSAIGMLLIGLFALWFAFETLGNPKEGKDRKKLLAVHRIAGYLFMVMFLLTFAGMALRFKSGVAFSSKADLHVTFASAALVLLVVKFLIARRFKKLAGNLFFIGSLLFLCSAVAVINPVGSRIGSWVKSGLQKNAPTAIAKTIPGATKAPTKMLPVEEKVVRLCTSCHPLGQAMIVITEKKTKEELVELVNRMREKTDTISKPDAAEIADYLSQF